jgi:hypothetical protein
LSIAACLFHDIGFVRGILTGDGEGQLRAVTMERIKALDAVITSVDQALKITHSN